MIPWLGLQASPRLRLRRKSDGCHYKQWAVHGGGCGEREITFVGIDNLFLKKGSYGHWNRAYCLCLEALPLQHAKFFF